MEPGAEFGTNHSTEDLDSSFMDTEATSSLYCLRDVKPHTTKVACFLLLPCGSSLLGGSDCLSTIRHELS